MSTGPAPRYDTVSLLTDYGSADEFVGILKSVLRSIAPHAVPIDISHEVPPHDVRAGGLTLARSVQYLAPGVVVAVVDPGVGTARRAIAVEVGDGQAVLVGPDNGLLAPAVAMCDGASRAVELTNTDYQLPAPGATFAGRDIFAPAAAHLCNGVALTDLGPEIDPAGLRPGLLPVSRQEGGELVAEVLWVDRFGNAQLNLGPDDLDHPDERVIVRFGDTTRSARLVEAYAELATGELGMVVDSYGLLSLSFDQRSVAAELGLGVGTEVFVALGDDAGGEGSAPAGVTVPVELRTRPGAPAPEEA